MIDTVFVLMFEKRVSIFVKFRSTYLSEIYSRISTVTREKYEKGELKDHFLKVLNL
jgi:hypothetical protein